MATVGLVIRPHGRHGEVVVAAETDFATERFAAGAIVHRRQAGQVECLAVVSSRPHAGRWLVAFDGVTSIDEAERLRGAELKIPAEALRSLAEDSYYLHDLAGCEVRTTAGEGVGQVTRVDMVAGQPMLVIVASGAPDADEREGRADEPAEVLVPFTSRMCPVVDVAARRIEIDPPAGLIDLNRGK